MSSSALRHVVPMRYARRPEVATVLRAVPIVAHHEVVAGGMSSGPQLSCVGARAAAPKREPFNSMLCCQANSCRRVRRRDGSTWFVRRAEALALRRPVHVEQAAAHVQRVARHADETLHEGRRGIVPRAASSAWYGETKTTTSPRFGCA